MKRTEKTSQQRHRKNRQSPAVLRSLIGFACPILRSFPIEIRGRENLPEDAAVYVCNHSNSHDVFIGIEVFKRLGRPLTPFVAWDGLNFLSRTAFTLGNAVFIRRPDKSSRHTGYEEFCTRLHQGENGMIFPESTWNLHPTLPMQKLNAGFIRASLETGRPVVPMLLEYVEVPGLCRKESQLYTKCIVSFGKPFMPSEQEDVFLQAEKVRNIMAQKRSALWTELRIQRSSLEQINREVYMNHLDIKKNRAFGFRYNTEAESQFLLEKENEFILTPAGEFRPR